MSAPMPVLASAGTYSPMLILVNGANLASQLLFSRAQPSGSVALRDV